MEKLLAEIRYINEKHREIRRQKGEDFNLFDIMGMRTDEVKTHSAIIAELLNPKGSHGMGDKFLTIFLNSVLNIDVPENINETKVFIEHSIQIYEDGKYKKCISKDQTEGGRIDILLKHRAFLICIENKINAGDQPYQLRRYYNYLDKHPQDDTHLYYLTLDGKEASDISTCVSKAVSNDVKTEWVEDHSEHLSTPEDYKCISYQSDILSWLEDCFPLTIDKPILRESLKQYIILIQSLTGNTMDIEARKEVVRLLGKDNNILEAKRLIDNWNHIRWHVEWDFWCELEKAMKEKLIQDEFQKYSPKKLSGIIHRPKAQDSSPWYGLAYEIGKVKDYQICIYIERGRGNLFYGLMIKDGDKKWQGKSQENELFYQLEKATSNILDVNNYAPDLWIRRKEFEIPINFELFSNDETLKLCEPDYRKKIVKNLIVNIEEFESEVVGALKTVKEVML